MAIGRETGNARAERSKAAIAEQEVQVASERVTSAGAPPVIETIEEVADGNQMAEKLVDILSEAVYAYLKRKESVLKQGPLSGEEN